MTWLKIAHLKALCSKYEIDEAEIDQSITYSENKAHLINIAHFLHRDFSQEDMLEEAVSWGDRQIDRLVADVKQIIQSERRTIKLAKYNVGRRISEDEQWLTRRYGDNYFGRLATMINERGYSASQLYACVTFTRHEQAEEWLRDEEVGWEEIRTQRLPRTISMAIRFMVECSEAVEPLKQLARVYDINRSLNPSPCRGCPSRKVCRFAWKAFRHVP